MRRKIPVQTCYELAHAEVDDAVEGRSQCRNVLAAHWLVMGVEVRPHYRTDLRVAQFQFKSYAAHERASGNFFEVVEVSTEKIIAAHIAARNVDRPITARCAKFAKQDVCKHLGRSLNPTLVFGNSHTL